MLFRCLQSLKSFFLRSFVSTAELNNGWVYNNGVYYQHSSSFAENPHYKDKVKKYMSWNSAGGACKNAGGRLVEISSQGENSFVYGMNCGERHDIWIALFAETDAGNPSSWHWKANGTRNAYRNWAKGQPDRRDQGCAVIWAGAKSADVQQKWDNQGCRNDHVFVCQKGT